MARLLLGLCVLWHMLALFSLPRRELACAPPALANAGLARSAVITTTRSYGDAGNLLSESYSGGPLDGLSVINQYDSLLRRTNVVVQQSSNPLTHQASGFDEASRLKTADDGTHSASYDYLPNSDLLAQKTLKQSGTTRLSATNSFDNLNRLTRVTTVDPGLWTSDFAYAYNDANQRTSVTLADGSYWAYGHDTLGQLTSARRYWSDGLPVAGQQFTYEYDDIGNRLASGSGGNNAGASLHAAAWTNNTQNQLTGRDIPGYAQVLGSANSNATITLWGADGSYARAQRHGEYYRGELPVTNTTAPAWFGVTNLAVLQNGTNAEYLTNAAGKLLLAKTPEAPLYDVDGNLTNNGLWSIGWDAESRPTTFQSAAGVPSAAAYRLDCVYDYAGRRTQKIVSTNNGSAYVAVSTNRFVYDGWNLLAILDGQSSLLYSFTWGADASGTLHGAGGVGGLVAMTVHSGANAGTYFYVYDGNFNVVGLVSASDSSVAARYEYGPFGELIRATGPLAQVNPFLFSTKFYDWETGCYYYGYRYYDPSTGRWLSRDPMGEDGGMNTYAFLGNDPEDYTDFLGLAEVLIGPDHIVTVAGNDLGPHNSAPTYELGITPYMRSYTETSYVLPDGTRTAPSAGPHLISDDAYVGTYHWRVTKRTDEYYAYVIDTKMTPSPSAEETRVPVRRDELEMRQRARGTILLLVAAGIVESGGTLLRSGALRALLACEEGLAATEVTALALSAPRAKAGCRILLPKIEPPAVPGPPLLLTGRACTMYPLSRGLNYSFDTFDKYLGTLGEGPGVAIPEVGAAEGTTAVRVGDYTLTDTVAGHLGERVGGVGEYSGSLSRPYLQSPSTINEIIATGKGVPDPGGLSGALRYDVQGAFRGSAGNWELVVDPNTQTIYHFNFTTGP